jgi:putative ABC transport system permease protein
MSFLRDLRFAARSLSRTPGFTAVAVATLALGIGANTAIFTVVRAVLLKPLPYRDAERLVVVWEDLIREGNHRFSVAAPNFEDLRRRSRSFEGLAAQLGTGFALTGAGETPEAVLGARVTGDFFAVLGAKAALGRAVIPSDEVAGKAKNVAVLGHALWQRRFAGARDVVGRTIRLYDVPYEVVGVMPPDFEATSQLKAPTRLSEVWVPLEVPPRWNDRGIAVLQVVGRVRRGVAIEAADSEVRSIARTLAREYPATNENVGMHAVPLSRQIVGDVRPALLVLSGAVGFVLIVACANIAHLLLVRSGSRRRETAIRAALGASRARIASAFLAEGLVLAAAGGALAWLLVSATVSLLVAAAPPDIPRLAAVSPDLSILAFAFGAATLAGLASAILPALRAAGEDPEPALRGEGVASAPSSGRLRAALVVSQIAIALVLFSGAALLVRTFESLRRFDLGFDPEGVATARLAIPRSRYDTPEKTAAFYDELFRRLEASPGVSAAGTTSRFPLDPAYGVGSITFEGRPASPGEAPVVGARTVGGRYFTAMRIPVLSGRAFDSRDRSGALPTVLVNGAMAKRFWPAESPVGKRIAVGSPRDAWLTVVGVVGDVSHDGIDAAAIPEVYLPLSQNPDSGVNLVVRGSTAAPALLSVLRGAVASVDRELPLIELRPMADRVADALAQPRFLLGAFGGFSLLTLLLASLALYALVSHDAERRRREVGIRMALGARREDVVRLFFGRASRLVAAGVAAGLAGALALSRLLRPALHGVRPADPLALGGAAVLLVAVALAAALLPARRATRGDPLESLRRE